MILHPTPGEDPDRFWPFPPEPGMTHIRGGPHVGSLTGDDLAWDISYDGNNNLDLFTFTGVGWGPILFSGTWDGLTGTFEGQLVIHFDNFYLTGKFVCHGTGDYEGMHLKGTFEVMYGTIPTPIVIHNPHG